MSASQIWTNIIAYALQIGLLVGIGASLPALLRLKSPGARLLYWQLVLVACLALPWLRPWQSEVITVASAPIAWAQTVTPVVALAPQRSAIPPVSTVLLWLLAAGVTVRLVWLAVGLLKLARYRRHGRAIPLPPEWTVAVGHARVLLSEEIGGPVTFGFFRPVVLLPASFPSLPEGMRDAILFHELTHVERSDWLFTFAEELVRSAFWFHPAIWWVLGEIQLAREQTVDRAVIEMTQARDSYVDALLSMAGVTPQLDLAPAPLFLRRRHLKQRVMGIVREVGMSKTRLILAQVAALSAMAVACWFITGAIPLHAQAQVVADGPGVTVNLNGSRLMHRTPVSYPAEALAKGVDGTVVVQVRLDASGQVTDDAILSGPDELRKGVQQSVLNWHFDRSEASTTRAVNIDFVKPASSDVATVAPVIAANGQVVATLLAPAGRGGASEKTQQALEAEYQFMREQMATLEQRVAQTHDPADAALLEQLRQKIEAFKEANAQRLPQPSIDIAISPAQRQQALRQEAAARLEGELQRMRAARQERLAGPPRIDSIVINGLSDSAREELVAQLPIHVGDTYSDETLGQTREIAQKFDEHLTVSAGSAASGSSAGMWTVRIETPDARAFVTNTPQAGPAGAARIGGNVMAANLIKPVKPIYPQLAKDARVQGTVRFQATVGKDGTMEDLQLLSGPPLLVKAAFDAVKQWVYKPTMLNGAAVEVVTTIDVNFALADGFPLPQ